MKLGATNNNGVQEALRKLNNEPLSAQAAFKLKKILDVVDRERTDFLKVRQDYVQKYANKNEDGTLTLTDKGEPTFSGDNIQIFTTVHNELCYVDIPLPSQIKITDLSDRIKLSASEVTLLGDPDVGVLDLDGYTPPALVDKSSIELPDAVPQATAAPATSTDAPATTDATTSDTAAPATSTEAPNDAGLGPDPTTASSSTVTSSVSS